MRSTILTAMAILVIAAIVLSEEAPVPSESIFAAPVKLTAGDAVIDVTIGHADPFVCDLNGDGKLDLLVGQFGGGKLLYFANAGTNAEPKLSSGEFVRSGEVDLSVPSG